MKKILLIKKGAIGDVLMTTPLIRQLNKSGCKVDYVVGKSASIAIKDNPYVDNIFILDDDTFNAKNLFKLARYYTSMRNKYDYVFILDKHWYFIFLAKLIGGITVGFSRDTIAKYLLNKAVEYNDVNYYQVNYYLDLLNISGLSFANYKDNTIDFVVKEIDHLKVVSYLKDNKIDKYVVIVNSGGNSAFEKTGIRMLPMSKFQGLVQALIENGNRVILSGGKADYDNNQEVLQLLNYPKNLYNIAGKLSLSETAALFSSSNHVYTTDCGAMHIAKVVAHDKFTAYFGATNPQHILSKNLMKNAIWYDDGIYNIDYQLYGKTRLNEPDYFMKLQFPRDL